MRIPAWWNGGLPPFLSGGSARPRTWLRWLLFLASGRANFVNDQEIIVDGGFEHMLMSLVPRPGYERGN